jgi:serine/threonine protein kinase
VDGGAELLNGLCVGQIVAGKYRLDKLLGDGGMGVVVAASNIALDMPVALKFLRREALVSRDAVARFLREAQAAVQIQSEHVARVFDVGTLETGEPYIVMEHLRGADLAKVVTDRGPLPIEETIDYLLQACEAVAVAHSLGIVHRDLKPSNLFLTTKRDGSALIKVLDFGISKALDRESGVASATLTATGMVMGSPAYMSPEQIRSSKKVDARTDIWALGIVAHELMTGRPPFDAETMPELIAMITADPPTPLRVLRPDAPPQLEAIIQRCLAKNPDERVQTVAGLVKELLHFATKNASLSAADSSAAERLRVGSGPVQVPPVGTDPNGRSNDIGAAAWGRTRGSGGLNRARPAFVFGVVGAAVLALVFAAFISWPQRNKPAGVENAPRTATASATNMSVPPALTEKALPTATAEALPLPALAPATVDTEVPASGSATPRTPTSSLRRESAPLGATSGARAAISPAHAPPAKALPVAAKRTDGKDAFDDPK